MQSVQRVAGEVVVEGHLLVSDAVIRASVNVGDVGFAACVADLSLQMPRFRMRCPVSPADPQTWIQMASFPPGRYLGRTALNLLVAPGEPSDVYARRKLPGTDAEVTQQTLTARFLEAVNAVRASAGLPALQLEAAESELASRLAPHYFDAAQVRLDPARADLIYLGLRAGWEVSGMVRYGLFGSSLTVGSRSLRFLVDDLLDLPLGREALLDPAVDRVALGTVWSDEQVGMGVLFSTYAMFGQDDPAKLAVQVRAHLNASRARAGRGPVGSLSGLADDDGTGRASTLLAEGQAPGQALRGVMGSASRVFAAAVQGYYITTDGVDHLEWPEELLLLDRVDVQISVGWHQPPDEPWGSYVVFVVYPSRGVEI
ncbi:MAG: hypothetical protein KC933_09620 [Myxococcales bacterium]|nr:hypothetical protein [Myxococcales bacterium]